MRFATRMGALAAAAALGVLPATRVGAQGSEADAREGVVYRDPQAVTAYEEGVSKLKGDDFKGAIESLNRALAVDPAYAEALVSRGDALRGMQFYEDAIKSYAGVFSLGADPVVMAAAATGRGEAYMELGRYDLALTDFYAALEVDRNNARILSNIGHVLVNSQSSGQQDPTTPLRFLDDALAIDANDGRAYRDRGLAHVRLGEFEESIADLKKSIEVDPADYENFSTLATIYLYQEDYAPAIDAISQAIDAYKPKKRIDPKVFVDGYLMRADARQRAGAKESDPDRRKALYEESIADCNKVLEVFKDRFPQNGIAYYRRGRAQRMLENYSKAIDSFTQAIQYLASNQDPGYGSEAYLFRGICWHYIGSEVLARGDFQQASGIGGGFSDPRVYLWIGYTYHLEGDYREAINWYSQAIAKNSNFTLAHVNRGRAYMDLNEYRRAIDSFNDAIRTEPNVGEHYYDVGYAFSKLEEYQKAVDFYDLALLKDNPQPKMYRGMAEALRALGRNELADRYERQADDAEPRRGSSNS